LGRNVGRAQNAKLEKKKKKKKTCTRRQLHLEMRVLEGFDRKAFRLGFVKQVTRISSRLRKVKDWAVWRGQPPPKWKNLLARLAVLA
jgi:hypothetical protein